MENSNIKFRKLVKKFYVKLYLYNRNREDSCNCNTSTLKKVKTIRDATRSWHSLSPEDKEIFIEQYQTRGSNHKVKIANYLKTATTKQIKKLCESQQNDVPELNQTDDHNNKTTEDIANCDESENREPNNEYSNHFSSPMTESMSVEKSTDVDIPDITQIWREPSIRIPEPPAALNAHQLFDLVNPKNNDDYRPWESLAPTDRRRYQDALLKLKKNYLKKYELYLQNLTSKELYYHMIDIISNTIR